MSPVAALAGISFAVGVAIGVRLHPAPIPPEERNALAAGQAVSQGRNAGDGDLPLLRERAEMLRRRNSVQASQNPVEGHSDAASLKARSLELIAKRDGENLLVLIRECLLGGPDCYPLALELAAILWDDEESFGLKAGIVWRLERGGLQPAVTWALQHFESLPADSLSLAIWCAGMNPEDHEPDALQLLLRIADTCPDEDLALSAAHHLLGISPELDPDLEAFIRRHPADGRFIYSALSALSLHRYAGLDDIFSDLVAGQRDNEATLVVLATSMANHLTPTSLALLATLSRDPLPRVAEEARFHLNRARPPVSGLLVERAARREKDAHCALRRGDIVTRCDGEPLLSLGDLAKNLPPGEAARRVTVRRGDETIELDVDAEELRGAGASIIRK